MLEIILPILAMFVAVGGILVEHFGVISKGMNSLRDQITELETTMTERITRVETKVELFWKGIEGNVANLLKSPTHHRKDSLLDKLTCKSLNKEEAVELKGILAKEFNGRKKNSNNLGIAYALALTRLDLVIYELGEEGG